MTKKHFIKLADAIIEHNDTGFKIDRTQFSTTQLMTLAAFCQSVNPDFKTERWLDYINGKCGVNGGAIK